MPIRFHGIQPDYLQDFQLGNHAGRSSWIVTDQHSYWSTCLTSVTNSHLDPYAFNLVYTYDFVRTRTGCCPHCATGSNGQNQVGVATSEVIAVRSGAVA